MIFINKFKVNLKLRLMKLEERRNFERWLQIRNGNLSLMKLDWRGTTEKTARKSVHAYNHNGYFGGSIPPVITITTDTNINNKWNNTNRLTHKIIPEVENPVITEKLCPHIIVERKYHSVIWQWGVKKVRPLLFYYYFDWL